jgi:hypothetical protein
MPAGRAAVAGDGVGVHPAEPAGPADAAPLGDVLQDRLDLPGREAGIEQGRRLAFEEAGLAGAAAEHPSGLAGSARGLIRVVGHGPLQHVCCKPL